MASLRVYKFGGTSVGNVSAFKRSAEVLQANLASGSQCVGAHARRRVELAPAAPP